MTIRLYLFAVLFFLVGWVNAQEEVAEQAAEEVAEEVMEKVDDAFMSPMITDDMTEDASQNSSWRTGDYKYSSKPKSSWEVGIHLGHLLIDGDVDRKIPSGLGFGLHLRKALHYVFSVRFDLMVGSAKGLDPQPSGSNLLPEQEIFQGYGPDNPWFFAHKTRYGYGAIQGIFNLGNVLFHSPRNKWNINVGAGVGLTSHRTMLDLRDSDGQVYTNLVAESGYTPDNFNERAGRSDIKSSLRDIYDGDYETEGFQKKGIFRLGDDSNIHFLFTGSFGVARKISKKFNIGLEHQVNLSDNDYLDGQKWRTNLDQTNNVDIVHYTNVRLAFNLGNMDDKTEPLYWLNPLDATFGDIAELKKRPILDLTDSDDDGIIDMLDQEPETPAGYPVDTRGVTLDSDNDGISDGDDTEPYSPPGFDIGDDGVAKIPEIDMLDEADVMRIINENCPGCKQVAKTGCGEWFLPMIHYDLNKYNIKPEFYGQLHHVATVMKQCPEICVVVEGHADSRNSNEYNDVLSYNRAKAAADYLVTNYGIDRSRLKLMYGGENSPLVSGANSENKHYMNRRVEFRLCDGTSRDMGKPAGPANAGQGGNPGSRGGNKNSGY